MPIHFFSEEINYTYPDKLRTKQWLSAVAANESKTIGELNYIFCSDEYLLEINKTYLNHNTFTDVITFDYCADDKVIGEIYISIDRIKDNAARFNSTVADETHRVLVHGLLHLLGYKDKKPADKNKMTAKEDYYLKQYNVPRGTSKDKKKSIKTNVSRGTK